MNYRGHSAGLSPITRVVGPWLALLLAGLSLIAANLARATPFEHTIAFTASGFDPGAPQDPVSGTVTLTYDPLVPIDVPMPIDALDLVIAGQTFTPVGVLFVYLFGLTGSHLAIVDPSPGPPPGTNGFELELAMDSTGRPLFDLLIYTLVTSDRAWGSTSGTFSFVPEPSTLALLSLGLAGLGFSRRRKLEQAVHTVTERLG